MEAALSSSVKRWSREVEIDFCLTHVYSNQIKRAKKLNIYEGFKKDPNLKKFWQIIRGSAHLPMGEHVFNTTFNRYFDDFISKFSEENGYSADQRQSVQWFIDYLRR